ncbi:MAG: hypothetical protein ABIN25_14620 [Ginsengibacter sp.]
MKEITLEVDEKKYNFFLDLLKNFDFVSIKKDSKKETILSIAKGMQQARLAADGKAKSRPVKSFLDEL